MAISIEIRNLDKLNRVAQGMPKLMIGLRGQVQKATYDFSNRLIRQAKLNVTKGGRSGLNVRTGKLRASINARVTDSGDTLSVTLGANTIYARIHEKGGVTKPHIIAPARGKSLAFMFKGKMIFARYVRHPGSWIPARPYLQPAIDAELPRLQRAVVVLLKNTAQQGFKAA